MELLFTKGRSVTSYPVKLVFLETPVDLKYRAQAMFVVGKKNFKRSPDRNKLKRRMREVYRLGKNAFYTKLEDLDIKLVIAFIYTSKKEEEYKTIETAITKLLQSVPKEKKI